MFSAEDLMHVDRTTELSKTYIIQALAGFELS